MYNKEFFKFEKLKSELELIKCLCPDQYFSVEKCPSPNNCKRNHVPQYYYPCIHFYSGNCKYGFNCRFSHSIKRQIVRPEPAKETCKKQYYENYCPLKNKCKYSHELREYPCVYNSIGKCKFSNENCKYSHVKRMESEVICFFNLMNGCKNDQCENKHTTDNMMKFISYEGPL